MNKLYFILPAALLAAFIAYYSQFSKSQAILDQQRAEAKARLDAEEAEKKHEAIEKAAEDARKREEAQRAETQRAEDERRAKWDAENKKIADDTAQYQQNADQLAKQAADLQIQLDSLHADDDKASRELFDLQKQIEQARIDRRNADLEIQRTYDIVTQKVAASPLANFALPPAK